MDEARRDHHGYGSTTLIVFEPKLITGFTFDKSCIVRRANKEQFRLPLALIYESGRYELDEFFQDEDYYQIGNKNNYLFYHLTGNKLHSVDGNVVAVGYWPTSRAILVDHFIFYNQGSYVRNS